MTAPLLAEFAALLALLLYAMWLYRCQPQDGVVVRSLAVVGLAGAALLALVCF